MDSNGGSDGSCHYSVLQIRKDASQLDIRAAYRKLALKWHPDRCTKNPSLTGDANRRFQRIQEAYSVLSDERKRSMYDGGTLDLFDDDDDEGMGEFMHDLFKMMDDNNNNTTTRVAAAAADGSQREVRKEESLEDLQRCFMETFGADLASYLNVNHQSKSSSSSSSSRSRTTPYDRATPKRTNSTSTSNSRAAKC